MLPAIGEVVLVPEALTQAQPEIAEPHAARVGAAAIPVAAPLDDKTVKVLITPAESCLRSGMQVGQGTVAADEQPAPDQRADVPQDDVQLVDHRLGDRGRRRHRAIITPLPNSPVASPLVFTLATLGVR
jgi:hypothetical protein